MNRARLLWVVSLRFSELERQLAGREAQRLARSGRSCQLQLLKKRDFWALRSRPSVKSWGSTINQQKAHATRTAVSGADERFASLNPNSDIGVFELTSIC